MNVPEYWPIARMEMVDRAWEIGATYYALGMSSERVERLVKAMTGQLPTAGRPESVPESRGLDGR